MKKKIVALGLVVALSVSSLTGCSFNSKTPVIGKIVGLGSSEMFKIDKEVCSKQEYMLVLMDTAGTYKADLRTSRLECQSKRQSDTAVICNAKG